MFVNHREDFEFARHKKLKKLIDAELWIPSADGNESTIEKITLEHRFDTVGIRQMLIENGLIRDTSNVIHEFLGSQLFPPNK